MHRANATSVIVTATFTFISSLFIFSATAHASTVDKVKGSQAIVTFDGGETPAAGDKFIAMENGKKRAILEVVQFKNGRAKVNILKGTAKEGMTLAAAKHKGAKASTTTEAAATDDQATAPESESPSKKKKSARSAGSATLFKDMTIGAVAGYSMDSQTVTQSGTSTAMTGSGMSLKAFVDIPVTGSLGLYSRVGVEQFNVQAGTSKSELMYGVLDLLLKYSFTEGTFVPFAMAGLGIHFPISKSSNVLNTNLVSSTTVFYGGGGFNYALGGSTYLQLTAEYGMFPPSNDVSTSLIAVRAGMGFRF
jgi:hypothetical protein